MPPDWIQLDLIDTGVILIGSDGESLLKLHNPVKRIKCVSEMIVTNQNV